MYLVLLRCVDSLFHVLVAGNDFAKLMAHAEDCAEAVSGFA